MKVLTEIVDYNDTINIAKQLNGYYNKSVYFHCYWNGNLNKKHLCLI